MKYTGSCHCGKIAFEVEGELKNAMACNCSICQRKGVLMWFVPAAQVQLLTPRERLSTYLFNKHVIKHHFCNICGIHPFGEASDKEGNPTFAINIRCLENIDPLAVPSQVYNGKDI